MLIEEQNQFTATEVATLVPLYNERLYQLFLKRNNWIGMHYPNFPRRSTERTILEQTSRLQKLLEWPFTGQLGERLDAFFFQNTLRFWQKKFANFDAGKFSNALKSRPYVSKHHPQDFQNKVLNRLEELIRNFEQQHKVSIERLSTTPLPVQNDK